MSENFLSVEFFVSSLFSFISFIHLFLAVEFKSPTQVDMPLNKETKSNQTRSWPCRLGLQNTPTASLQRGKTPPTSVLDMTI